MTGSVVLSFRGALYVPAESVDAVFEVKQSMDADQVNYASDKVASVRTLHRTNIRDTSTFTPNDPETIGPGGCETPLKRGGFVGVLGTRIAVKTCPTES